jgi:uncharacterized membrane protein
MVLKNPRPLRILLRRPRLIQPDEANHQGPRVRNKDMQHAPPPPKHVPFIDPVREELSFNIADREQTLSALVGAGLVGFGITRTSWRRWLFILLGGALLKRGMTGHCDLYDQLHINTRHHAPSSGVGSGRGTKIEHSVIIHCPAQELYLFWRKLDQLPHILRHVKTVEQIDGTHSHWIVRGPFGQQFEWDAEIVNDHESELIAWRSLSGATVPNAGSVRFEQLGNRTTRLSVTMEFESPAGSLGLTIAELLGASPQQELEEDLATFKDFAQRELSPESGSIN